MIGAFGATMVALRQGDVSKRRAAEGTSGLLEEGHHHAWLRALKSLRSWLRGKSSLQARHEDVESLGAWLDGITICSSAPYLPPLQGRVLMSLHSSLPMHRAGYTYRSHALLKELKNLGREVNCYTRPGYPGDIRKFAPEAPEGGFRMVDAVNGIDYRRLTAPSRYARGGPQLTDYLRNYAEALQSAIRQERVDVIHTVSNFVNPAAGCLAARDARIPFIHEVRGFWELTGASRNSDQEPDARAANEAKIEVEAASRADRVLTLNGPMKAELIERGIKAERIVIVPNAVDPETLSPMARDAELAGRLGLDDAPTIGYVGSFAHYEGLDDVILAMHRMKARGLKFNGLLVGDGEVFESLGNRVRELDLAGEVRLTGRVEHDLVQRYYSLIDIAPFPRKPFRVCELVSPMKPYEAMGMAKTVVVSDVAAQAEMVEHGVTGFTFRKGNTDSLADRLELLVNDRDLCRQVGEQGRKWVLGHRTWRHSAEIVDQVYSDLTAEWAARRKSEQA